MSKGEAPSPTVAATIVDSTNMGQRQGLAHRGLGPGPRGVAAFALVAYGAYAAVTILRHGVESFALVAPDRLFQSRASLTIDRYVHVTSATGYDGQFYLFTALDPTRAWHYMDSPVYRYTHIIYPMLARAVVLGQPSAIPYALVGVNVVAISAGTLAIASFLLRHGRSPSLAVLYCLFPGIYRPFTFDLCEPLAFAFVAGGLWFLTEGTSARAFGTSVALFACGGLTRETTLVVPIVLALAGFAGIGPLRGTRRASLLLVGCAAPYFVYRAVLDAWLGGRGQTPNNAFEYLPFGGLAAASTKDIFEVVGVAFAGLALLAACVVVAARIPRDGLVIALVVNLLVSVVFLNPVSYDGYNAAGRLQIGSVILAFWTGGKLRSTRTSRRMFDAALVAAYSPMVFFALAVATSGFKPG